MRLRFTIRDLLWLTLVVALVLGWIIDHRASRVKRVNLIVDYNTGIDDAISPQMTPAPKVPPEKAP